MKAVNKKSTAWRSERYTRPFRCLSIDLVGPDTVSNKGCPYRYALTTVDMFSYRVWGSPLVPSLRTAGSTWSNGSGSPPKSHQYVFLRGMWLP